MPSRPRRFLTHVLVAALLCGAAAPLAWMAYDRVQAGSRVRMLADAKTRSEAMAHLYAHAGGEPALVRALAREAAALPPETAAEALRVAAQSCAKAGAMNPAVAEAAAGVLPRLAAKDRLLLLANLGAASLAADPKAARGETRDFNEALGEAAASEVRANLAADAPDRALKVVSVFENAAKIETVAKAGLAAYLAHLEKEDGPALLRHAAPLDGAAKWGADLVKPALYNRWLAALAQYGASDSREHVVALLRVRPKAGDYPELGSVLLKLAKDPEPRVRLAALHAATEWVRPGGATISPSFAAAIGAAAKDADPQVAREAWIVLGLLGDETPAIPADLPQLPSPVAEAAYDTLAKARPHDDALAARLADILDAGDSQAISAAHALTLCDAPTAKAALAKLLAQPSDGTLRQLCQWRAVLAADPTAAGAFLAKPGLPDPLGDAAAFALHARPADLSWQATDEASRRRRLATLEGLPPASATFDTPTEDLGPAFYALAKAERDPAKVILHLRPLFAAKEPVWRDLACLLAAKRLDKAQATELSRDLLSTPQDEAMMSGAVLAGLSRTFPRRILGGSAQFRLEHPEWTEDRLYAISDSDRAKLGLQSLDALTDNLNRWGDARTTREKGVLLATQLGLALRGDAPADLGAMLFDPRIPPSTVLLAMLWKDGPDRRAALDALLGDAVRTPFVPRRLLGEQRFAEALAECLPKDAPDAPPRLDYWADIHLQKLQYERLRAWWRLHRNSPAGK